MFRKDYYIVLLSLKYDGKNVEHNGFKPDYVYKQSCDSEYLNVYRTCLGIADAWCVIRYDSGNFHNYTSTWRYATKEEEKAYDLEGRPVLILGSPLNKPINRMLKVDEWVKLKDRRGPRWNSEGLMDKFKGNVVKIKSFNDHIFRIYGEDWGFSAEDIEEYLITPKPNDWVRLKDRIGPGWSMQGGMDNYKGKIVKVKELLLLDTATQKNMPCFRIFDNPEWVFRYEDIDRIESSTETIKPKEVTEYQSTDISPIIYPKVGDYVKLKNKRGKGWSPTGAMDEYKGAIVKIQELHGKTEFSIFGAYWFFRFEDIEEICDLKSITVSTTVQPSEQVFSEPRNASNTRSLETASEYKQPPMLIKLGNHKTKTLI